METLTSRKTVNLIRNTQLEIYIFSIKHLPHRLLKTGSKKAYILPLGWQLYSAWLHICYNGFPMETQSDGKK